MAILILSTIYAPDRSPRAYRWTAIAERWAAQGRHVEVIAAWKRGDARREERNGVTIHRVGGLVEHLRGALGQASHRSAGPGPTSGTPAPRSRLLPGLAKAVYRVTVKQLLWPDYAFHWYPAARRAALALCASGRFDAVVSVSHPFTPHLVGLAVKRRHPGLRWLVDIGDPFSLLDEIPLNNRALYRRLNRRAEAAVLRAADAAAVTVERCRTDYQAEFAEAAGKIAVVPPLLSLPEAGGQPAKSPGNGSIHLACIGTLYRALRDPGPLLALFAALRRRRADLQLHFYGAINDCAACFEPYRDELGRSIHLHGMVPRGEIAGVMRGADILVNLGNATPHQLPSKLVEYAASCRPILNLAASPSDSAGPFLAGYPAALTIHPASSIPDMATVDAALAFITAPPPVDPNVVERFLAPYTIERIAAAYGELLLTPPSRESRAAG